MESRYINRFKTLGNPTGEQIKNRDSAGNLTAHITNARATIATQKQNIGDLFATSQELVTGINTHQQMIGFDLVKNIPLPTDEIKKSPSSQLGYVQLAMRFLQAGVLHFSEQLISAQDRIDSLEKTIASLAEYDEDLDIIGRLQTLDLDTLENMRPILPPSPPESVTSPVQLERAPVEVPKEASQTGEKKESSTSVSKTKNPQTPTNTRRK